MKNVLIVDDEKTFLLSLVQGLAPYKKDFTTHTAANGKDAVEVLQTLGIDLVITDLKMPEMDGFGLLTHMNKNHPNIPAIVMSAYCTPEIRTRLKNLGSFKILEKPIDFQDFVEQIFTELQAASKGYINGISLPAFLQLVEMERKTCTLRIVSQDKIGFLYFLDGHLIEAENGNDVHEKAALDIASWDNPVIEIDSICRKKEINIKASLGYIIMEGYRMLDERQKPLREQKQAAAKVPPLATAIAPAKPISIAAPGPEEPRSVLKSSPAEKPVERKLSAEQAVKEEKMATTKEILGELAKVPSIEAVCLVARDGFLVDSIARSGIDKEMIGAIASSGFGASVSMGKQLEKGAMQISMIEFEKGPVLLTPIGDDAFLVIVADKDANLGMIRLKLKKHSHELAVAAAI